LLPAYLLGERPDESVLLTAWSASVAAQFSGSVRAFVDGEGFERLYPHVRPEPKTEHDYKWWGIAGRQGKLLQVGAGAAAMSRSAGLVVFDTPYRSREFAESEYVRGEVLGWYRRSLLTKLSPGGALVIVSPRYGTEDLCQTLLKEEGSRWEFVAFE
jgi:hypothetical protein